MICPRYCEIFGPGACAGVFDEKECVMSIRNTLAREWARADFEMENLYNCPKCGKTLALEKERLEFFCKECGWNPRLKESSDGNNGIMPELKWEKIGVLHVCPFGVLIGEDGKEFMAYFPNSKPLIFPPMTLKEAKIKFERIVRRKAKVMLKKAKEILEKLGDE